MNLNILHVFKEHGSPLHFDFILEQTGRARSTLYRHMNTLVNSGLVENQGKGLYAPGWLVDEMSRLKDASNHELIDLSMPIMREINHRTGESVNLTTVKGSKVKVLAHLESNHNLKYSYQEGVNLDIFKGASSKILLAYLPKPHQENLLSTSLDSHNVSSLREELKMIKKRGYALTRSEVDENAVGISAPILRKGKYIAAGISIAGPIFRIDEDKIFSYTKLLKEAALDISLILDEQ